MSKTRRAKKADTDLKKRQRAYTPRVKAAVRNRYEFSTMPKASPVKVIKTDGTIEVRPAFKTRKAMVEATHKLIP